MPIDSKECFAALTEDGQLWEIYQAAQSGGGGGGITSINGDTTAAQLVSGTAPITASTASGTTTISTSMNTARLLGRTTAGVGVAEEISVGTGLSLSAGTLSSTVTAGVTSVTATAPLTSSGGATPGISTSISTNRIVGRSTAGTGVMEQLTPVGITVSAGNITGIGGTVGTVDNAVPRADGTGGFTVQGSDIVIDDAVPFLSGVTGLDSTDYITVVGNTFVANQQIFFGSLTGGSALTVNTPYFVRDVGGAGANTFRISTTFGGGAQTLGSDITAGTVGAGQTNVAIVNNHVGQTNSSLVLTPKGTGALIAGPKPDGTAAGGNARGSRAVDLQTDRTAATQVASANASAILNGTRNSITNASAIYSVILGGTDCLVSGIDCFGSFVSGFQNKCTNGPLNGLVAGAFNEAQGRESLIGSGRYSLISGNNSAIVGGGEPQGSVGNEITSACCGILAGVGAKADRRAMHAHAAGRFAANGDAQRARFVLRCKTTTNAAVEMALDGGTTYLGIPSGKVIACTINISGVKSDGSAVAHYVRQYAVKNVGGTSSEVYAPVTIGTDNAAGTVIALSANNGDDTLRIAVTGIASETWRWVASVDAVEIAYGT